MRLSGSDYSELLQILLDAYDTASFARMLRIEFDKPLSHFASDKAPFPEIVAAVIDKSEQEDWTAELVQAAARGNPGNARLAQFAAAWQTRPDDAAQAGPASPPASGDGDRDAAPRRPWLLVALAVVVVVAAGFGVWFWLNNGGITPTRPAPPPTVAVTAAATAILAATDTPEPPEPTAMPALQIPPLPDFAPPLTTTVLLVDTPQCATQIAEMEAFLADSTAAMTPPVALSVVQPDAGAATTSVDARALGVAQGADLVIWCADTTGDNGAGLHFEALTQRSTPEVFEPTNIALTFTPFERSQRAALGIVNYLRRDYPGAEPLLRSVVAMGPESAPDLLLLAGNAQMFQRKYDGAAATYNEVVKAAPDWAQAWNNLGVAELNNAWLTHEFATAEAAFAEATRLDPAYDLPYLGLARIYRWTFDEVAGNAEKAFAACAQAEQSDDPAVSIQGALCTSLTLMLTGWTADADAKLPQVTPSKEIEAAASPYWADPLALLGIVESTYWMVNSDPFARQQAIEYFAHYLENAYDDIHLEESRRLYTDVVDGYALLQPDAAAP